MRTKRPARLKNFSYIGIHRYSLTFCTDWRRKYFENATAVELVLSQFFENATAVELVLSQFLRVARKEGFSILAYCFMPDHVHVIVQGMRADSDGKKFISTAKQCAAHEYAKKFKQRLWQPFGYEHVMRDDEDLPAKVRYVLENPVRAGLVKTVLEYPFSGSQVYDLRQLIDGLPQRDP
jgi:putative transposase